MSRLSTAVEIQAATSTHQVNSPSPILPKPSPQSSVSSALKAEAWTVPSSPSPSLSPTSLVAASTASSFDEGQTQAECPRPLHRLHRFSVDVGQTSAVCPPVLGIGCIASPCCRSSKMALLATLSLRRSPYMTANAG